MVYFVRTVWRHVTFAMKEDVKMAVLWCTIVMPYTAANRTVETAWMTVMSIHAMSAITTFALIAA